MRSPLALKVTGIMLVLLVMVGVLVVLFTVSTTRMHIQEGSQRLNRSLAEYLVRNELFTEAGEARERALQESFETLMQINHDIELYLLDADGHILSYAAPPGRVKLERVSLEPIRRFLEGTRPLPILGDDPRNPARRKVFSAAPVPAEGPLQGYLYVILEGEDLTSVAQLMQRSFVLRLGTWTAVGGLVTVFAMGLMMFLLLTRRLHRLAVVMEDFWHGGFKRPVQCPGPPGYPADEIDKLGTIFSLLSERVIDEMSRTRQADAQRRELIGHVSHDLRTPLAALQGYLETLLMKGEHMPPGEREQHLRTALTQAEHLSRLVRELFDLATLESGQTPARPESFNLSELVQDIVQKYRLSAEEKGIALQVDADPDLPFVHADIGLIERVIDNLLDNALRYTEAGGILITLARDESAVAVTVADTGSGIPAEDLPHIFDRYYRARGTRPGDGGTGLGLAIAKRILELHESTIRVESSPGAGARFSFTLRAHRPSSHSQ